jgi:nitronate monooxygenase
MALPELRIGDLTVDLPIIQGGMGVGVSKASLAGAVSAAGGLGVIASVGLGGHGELREAYEEESSRALIREIRKVKARNLPVGVNVMVALSNYRSLVEACAEGGADVIISGAGLPLRLPKYSPDPAVKIVPIVSSARAADLICKTWQKQFARLPDAIVVEGPMAGGHLGFKFEELADGTARTLAELVTDVLAATERYGQDQGKRIPIIAAGGVYTAEDITAYLGLGASGVQMGTRFVGTHECDASDAYKQAFVDATEDDVVLIRSPVGLPARVVRNAFVEATQNGVRQKFACPYKCLLSCAALEANYCIANALVNSATGDVDQGFAMCGQNAHRVDRLVSVAELMQELAATADPEH